MSQLPTTPPAKPARKTTNQGGIFQHINTGQERTHGYPSSPFRRTTNTSLGPPSLRQKRTLPRLGTRGLPGICLKQGFFAGVRQISHAIVMENTDVTLLLVHNALPSAWAGRVAGRESTTPHLCDPGVAKRISGEQTDYGEKKPAAFSKPQPKAARLGRYLKLHQRL